MITKKTIIIFLLILIAIFLAVYFKISKIAPPLIKVPELVKENKQNKTNAAVTKTKPSAAAETVVAHDLTIPWEIAFLPDGDLLVTERSGRLKQIGKKTLALEIDGVAAVGEGGLLGLVLHPDFFSNHWLYLYYTTRQAGKLVNQVDRYTLQNDRLEEKKLIIGNIPAAANHNGGRLKFGPDGFLYVTTGDSQASDLAQNLDSLAGKILRLDGDGAVPADNPFSSAVWSYGHRNVQGLAWDDLGRLWATEHGRSGLLSGLDELNLIDKGKNYGWPIIQGDEARPGLEKPIIQSGASATWAPSGAAYFSGSIFFAGLRGQALFQAKIKPGEPAGISELISHFKEKFGRLRSVLVGPDGNFYLLTNNTDGRGRPNAGDDKIIKIKPEF